MKRILLTIFLLFLISINSGCHKRVDIPDVTTEPIHVTTSVTLCPEPPRPQLLQLNKNEKITSNWNSFVILSNFELLQSYNDSLNDTILCYKKQKKD